MLTNSDNLLDTAAAARHCGYTYTGFIRLRTCGQLPPPDAWKGKRALYRVETLNAWFAAHPKRTWRLLPPVVEVSTAEVTAPIGADDTSEQAA